MNNKTISTHAIGASLLVVAGTLMYFVGYAPLNEANRKYADALALTKSFSVNVEDNQTENEVLAEQIRDVQDEIRKSYFYSADAQVPIIETVSQLLSSHEVELQKLKQGVASSNGTKIDLLITGDYQNIVEVLDYLRHMTLPAKVTLLRMNPMPSDAKQISAQLNVEFYSEHAIEA